MTVNAEVPQFIAIDKERPSLEIEIIRDRIYYSRKSVIQSLYTTITT